jgi:hypothetical protein
MIPSLVNEGGNNMAEDGKGEPNSRGKKVDETKRASVGIALVATGAEQANQGSGPYQHTIASEIRDAATRDIPAVVAEKVGLQKLLDELAKQRGSTLRASTEAEATELTQFAREFSQFAREFSQFAREFSRFAREG